MDAFDESRTAGSTPLCSACLRFTCALDPSTLAGVRNGLAGGAASVAEYIFVMPLGDGLVAAPKASSYS